MADIQILSDNITNKIAAGEVVRRPASVVKELVENAIDAGAGSIQVYIEDGGRQLVRVIDDGQGMEEQDLLLAFERHATSKIRDEADLRQIRTLGFRGEALASIAAVARVDAKSRAEGAEVGYQVHIQGGDAQAPEPVAMNRGTQIAVKDLFFNTPARRKFLKGKPTEYRHITEAMKRVALGRPGIRFELYHGDHETLMLPPASLQERIAEIFSPAYVDNLIEIDELYRDIGVYGFIGNLDLVRKSRGEQFLFLSNRYISDNLLNTAIYKGYHSLIQRGEYPFFVLNIDIEPSEYDVNVHPAKMEVKFKDQWQLYNYLRDLVSRSFRNVLHTAGHFEPPDKEEGAPPHFRQQNWTDTIHPREDPRYTPPAAGQTSKESPRYTPPGTDGNDQEREATHLERVDRYAQQQSEPRQSVAEQVWQVHNVYILSQIKSGLVIIDQHVAHERVLFEEALDSFKSQKISSQQLLFPKVIELSPEDFDLMLELLPYLEKIGFELKEFGKNTVILNATPSDMRGSDEAKLIRDIIDEYKERRDKDNPVHYNLAASYSCQAAIKAGDPLTEDEMRALIHRLFQCKNPYHCPHGRPVIVNLTLEEIHKRFERL